MIAAPLDYALRSAAVFGAAYFFAQALLTLPARIAAGAWSHRLRESDLAVVGKRRWLALRWLPAAGAAVFAGGLLAIFWRWEPRGAERAAFPFLIVAALGWSLPLVAAGRCALALHRLRRLTGGAAPTVEYWRGLPVAVVETDSRFVLLVGAARARLLISSGAHRALSAAGPEVLAAALDHEYAHHRALDNRARWLWRAAPDALPFFSGWRQPERAWRREREAAADAAASAGNAGQSGGQDPRRALALARALLCVAQTGSAPAGSARSDWAAAPAAGLAGDPDDLAARVRRLLAPPEPSRVGADRAWPGPAPGLAATGGLAAGLLLAAVAALLANGALIHSAYRLLEILIH